MSKKETRRLYCDEEELEYAKHCIQQRRAGLACSKLVGDPNGALEKKIADISEALDCIIAESIPELERRLIEKIDALRG